MVKKTAFFIPLFIVLLDQATKFIVSRFIGFHEAIDILPFLRIVHVTNRGAAFGSFQFLGNTFFIVLSCVAIVVVLLMILLSRESIVALSFILGGAVGNLIDRLRFGYVIDFLDVYAGKYHWPAFNVADSFISIGIVLMLFFYFLFPRKK